MGLAVRKLPPLSSLRAFEAAARLASFKDAASELGVTPTAVSHHIRALEERLEFRLFVRRPRGVELTEAGAALFGVVRHSFDDMAAEISRLTATRERQVRVSTTAAFAAKWLLPRLASLQTRWPNIDLQVNATDSLVPVGGEGVDLAIRYGRGHYAGLRSTCLFFDRFAVMASSWLPLDTPLDLAKIPMIHFECHRSAPEDPTWEDWFAAAQIAPPKPAAVIRFSEENLAIDACVAGQGAALLSLALTQINRDAGRLQTPFGPTINGLSFCLVEPMLSRPDPLLAAVRQWLLDETRSYRD